MFHASSWVGDLPVITDMMLKDTPKLCKTDQSLFNSCLLALVNGYLDKSSRIPSVTARRRLTNLLVAQLGQQTLIFVLGLSSMDSCERHGVDLKKAMM